MLTFYIFLLIFVLMAFVYIGLLMSDTINNDMMYTLFWVIYTLVFFTFMNVFVLGYFWSVVRKKTGPIGIRGPKGNIGTRGIPGKCSGKASHSIAIHQLILHLDTIHKTNLVQLDLDPKNKQRSIMLENKDSRLINKYMDRKIRTIVHSIQFETLLEALPLDIIKSDDKQVSLNYLISYLKQVVGEWYYLIYNQKEDWFYTEYDNMNADWKTMNPFNDIKKYDIYHWGSQRHFKPLKIDTCQYYPGNQTTPRLSILKTNDYELMYDDISTGANPRMNVWRPKAVTNNIEGHESKYVPVGDVITSGDPREFDYKKDGITKVGGLEVNTGTSGNGPSKSTILITGEVKPPESYQEMWRHPKKVSRLDDKSYDIDKVKDEGRLWKPIGPTIAGKKYVCLGDVVTNKYNPNVYKTNPKDYKKYNKDVPVDIGCVPEDCVEEVENPTAGITRDLVWKSEFGKNDVEYNGDIFTIGNAIDGKADNAYNTFRTDNYFYHDSSKTLEADRDRTISDFEHSKVKGPDGGKFYRIKQSCLQKRKFVPKKVDEEYKEIGLGWYGLPANNEPKYSVFHWMGLVPEGLIENAATRKKFYLVHYGGSSVNIYNFMVLDEISGKYTKSLEVKHHNELVVRESVKSNKKQQFKVVKGNSDEDHRSIYIESIYKLGSYVAITNDVEHYFKLNRNKNSQNKFSFQGAFNSLDTMNESS